MTTIELATAPNSQLVDELPDLDWITDAARIDRLSQDFSWFSPVLKRQLEGKDFGPSGIIGDPLPATAEQGHAILESLANSWAAAITELHQLRWAARSEPTWSRAHHAGHVQNALA